MKKLLTLVGVSFLLSGCPKDPAPPSLTAPDKVISRVVQTDGKDAEEFLRATYDSQGRLQQLVMFDDDVYRYEWSPNRLTVSEYWGVSTTPDSKEAIVLDAKGYASSSSRSWYDETGEPQAGPTYAYECLNDRISKATVEGEQMRFTWDSHGNMTQAVYGNDFEERMEYTSYPNHYSLDVNMLLGVTLVEFTYGSLADVLGERSTNLLSRYTYSDEDGDYTIAYSYTFESDLLTKITATDSDGDSWMSLFTYE